MFCNIEEFVFMRWDFEEQNRFHQRKIKHLILEASESKWTQMTCYCSRKRGSHCDECESKRPGQKPQTKHMFVWHFPGPATIVFKTVLWLGLHTSPPNSTARLVVFALDWGPKSPARGKPHPTPQPSGPTPKCRGPPQWPSALLTQKRRVRSQIV